MKICHFLASGDSGGLAKHLIDISNCLSASHEVMVMAPKSMRDSLTMGVDFYPVDFSSGPINSFISLIRMFSLIRKHSPDVMCAHGSKAAKILSFLKPYVEATCVGTLHWIEKKKKYFERLDGVIGVSNAALDGLNLETNRVIYNGVNVTSTIEPCVQRRFECLGIQEGKPLVMAIGRLVKVKGYDLLLEAWKGVDANLLIVGDGPLKSELEAQILQSGLGQKVFLMGHVDEAHQLINNADLVVISSLHEGFCYVLAEALRYRVPVVSTDVAAANEILPESLLSPTGDSTLLKQNLNAQLKRLPNLSVDLKGVFDWAEVALSVPNMAAETVEFYTHAIKEKSKKS